jgi:hypothetical protein
MTEFKKTLDDIASEVLSYTPIAPKTKLSFQRYLEAYKRLDNGDDDCVGCAFCRFRGFCDWYEYKYGELFCIVLTSREIGAEIDLSIIPNDSPEYYWLAELISRVTQRLFGFAIAEMLLLNKA